MAMATWASKGREAHGSFGPLPRLSRRFCVDGAELVSGSQLHSEVGHRPATEGRSQPSQRPAGLPREYCATVSRFNNHPASPKDMNPGVFALSPEDVHPNLLGIASAQLPAHFVFKDMYMRRYIHTRMYTHAHVLHRCVSCL